MALKSAWTTAPLGRMAPIEQAELWAVRAVLVDQGEAADQYQRMSRFVVKAGGGHPDRHVVKKFFCTGRQGPARVVSRQGGSWCREACGAHRSRHKEDLQLDDGRQAPQA